MDTPPHHTETGACNASPPPGLGDELAAAREATAAKMWRRALCLLQPLADSGSQEALSLLAEVLCAAGKPAQAAERLQTALGSTHTVTGACWRCSSVSSTDAGTPYINHRHPLMLFLVPHNP